MITAGVGIYRTDCRDFPRVTELDSACFHAASDGISSSIRRSLPARLLHVDIVSYSRSGTGCCTAGRRTVKMKGMKTSVGKVGETKIAIEKIENSTEDPFGSRSSSTASGRRSDRRGKRERKRVH